MKRITLLLSFVFMSVVAFGQSLNYSFEELEKLQMDREQTRMEAVEPSLDRAPFTSASIPPGHTQIGFRGGDIGYAWNIADNNAGIGTGPVILDIDDGTLTLIQAVDGDMIWMAAGDFADDTWYALSNEAAAGLYTVDPATGNYELVGSTGLGAATGLAYDVTSRVMYLSQFDGTNSQLYEVDLASGAVTLVGMITDGVIIAIAADNDGNIYGAKLNDDSLYSIDPATGAGTVIGPLGFAINFAQDIGYDRDNDILYGTLFTNSGGFYEIDTETGSATLIYNFIAEVAGFGIPYTFAEDAAPGPVTDYTVEPGDMGALEAHLAWTNPALTFDGEALTELTAVHLERNGEVIHTIDNPVIGGEVNFTDETVPEAGVYNYQVFGVNSIGEGPRTSLSLYIGEDVPVAPGNLILTPVDSDGQLSWDEPTEGLNGGYFIGENITYTVARQPENVVVAEDIEETEFLDTNVPGIGNYYYTVTASNLIGVGGTAASNVELLAAEGILMFESFDYHTGTLPHGWVLDGVPHAWGVWDTSLAGGIAPELRLHFSPPSTGLSRLITHPINVEGYSELRFEFKQALSDFIFFDGEVIGIDVTYDGGENWEALWEFEVVGSILADEYDLFIDVPEGETVMHLAFRFEGYSFNINHWSIDDMILEPVVDNDLRAVSISGNTVPVEGNESIYTVAVKNTGTVTQNDYTVKLMNTAGDELASVPGEPIEYLETINYQIAWTPMEEGPFIIYGYVDFPDDEVPDNNQTPHLDIVVQPDNIQVVTIGDGELLSAALPYNFSWFYSLNQTMYYPEEIGLSGGVITGIQYTNSFSATLTEKHIQIWMGETDMADLTVEWIDPASLQLVFDGLVDFPEGVNDILILLDDTYVYSGGNLVVQSYKQDDWWTIGGRDFFNTDDEGSGRTRITMSNDAPLDPINPGVPGFSTGLHPNTTMLISIASLGALEGAVTEDGEPVEGVNVNIMGTNANAQTDEDGFFEFPSVHPGTYDLHFTKFGYFDAMLEDVVVEEDETTVVSTEIEYIPTVSVMGTVVGSDFPEIGIAGATVILAGYDNYEEVTDADGYFVIEGVYVENDYTIRISAEGYDIYTDMVEAGTTDVDLGTIIVMETAFPVSGIVVAEETEDGALVSWGAPGIDDMVELYQHDGELPANPNAWFQTQNDVYGTIFDLSEYPDAVVSFMDFHHLDWGLPSDNYDYLVHIVDWANFEILETVGPLTTEVNDDWELEVPLGYFSVEGIDEVGILIQPQGHMPSDAYPIISADVTGPNGLSIRAPVDDLEAFMINPPQLGDYFITLWIYTSFAKDGIVKAEGLASTNLDPVQTRTGEAIPSASASLTQMANVAENEERAFESYRVYRLLDGEQGDMDDWAELVVEHTDTFYLDTDWEELAQGLWRYAVIAEYTNENLSDPVFSNILPKDMTVPFTVNVSTNSGDLPTGAMVHLTNMNEPQHQYEAVVPPTGIVDFLHVWRGHYAMTIELEGFNTYYVEDIDITEAATYDAELIETIVAPFALNVETFGLPHGDALLTWNTGGEVEFRYDDGIVDSQLGFEGTWNSVMGAVHHRDAELWEITWQLTAEGGPHNTVKVWVVGLTDDGFPDRDNIIYTAENVPNTDGEWNTYELSEALLLHDGFFIGLSYPGFLGLAVDDGIGEPWEFVPGTQFGVFDITDPEYEFTDLAFYGFEVNYLLRGYGLDFGPVDYGKGAIARSHAGSEGPAPFVGTEIDNPYDAGNPGYLTATGEASRAFEGFNVFLDGEMVTPEPIMETEYYFEGLDEDHYVAGVQSVYTTGESEIVTEEFFIGEVIYDVTFNVDMSELEDFDPDVHTVYLTGTFTGWAEPGTEGSIVMTEGEAPYITATLPIAVGMHEYKYFSDAVGEGWDGGEWIGDPNRELVVEGDMEVFDVFGDPDPDAPEPIEELPYFEDFTGVDAGDLPENWERTHTNWAVNNTNNAGGESAPELRFNWNPASVDVFRAITPLIDGTDVDAIDLTFMHSVNDFGGNYTIMVQTSIDGGETWDTQWEHYIAAAKDVPAERGLGTERDIPPTHMNISLEGVSGEEFHIAFVFDGNSWNIDDWYIDDILVTDEDEVELHTVTFDVVDEDGFAIEDAVIVLGPFENEPGDYVFHGVPAGTHEYTVTALCFFEHGDEITVDGDMEHEVVLELNIMPGDANGDGVVNVLDILAIGQYYSGNEPDNFCFHNADVNGDGEVNIIDIIATVNIFIGDKAQPYPGMQSSDAHIYMGDEGIMLHSDGTLAGIQFEITGDVAGLELKLEMPKHEIIYVNENGTIRAIIFSMDNTPFPAGLIDLVSFDRTASPGWLSVLAGNLNADEVPVIIHNDEITGIDDVVDVSFNAYPNPASDVIWVEFNNPGKASVSLINVQGQLVETQTVTEQGNQQIRFNTGNLPSGIYMLRLDHGYGFIIERIMVK